MLLFDNTTVQSKYDDITDSEPTFGMLDIAEVATSVVW